MPPVRIKVYGLVNMTKKTYLRIQGFGLVILLSLMAGGAAVMKLNGTWRPKFPPTDLYSGLILCFWVCLVTVLFEVVETTLVLRKFAHAERRQRAEQELAADSANPGAVRLASAVQPAPPPGNGPHP